MAKEMDVVTIGDKMCAYFHIRTLWDALPFRMCVSVCVSLVIIVRMWSNKTVRRCDKFVTVSSSLQHLSTSTSICCHFFSVCLFVWLLQHLFLSLSTRMHARPNIRKLIFNCWLSRSRDVRVWVCIYRYIRSRMSTAYITTSFFCNRWVFFFFFSYGISYQVFIDLLKRKWCGMLNGYKFQSNGRLIVC